MKQTIASPAATSHALSTMTTFISTSPKTTTTASPTFASIVAAYTIVPTGITHWPHCHGTSLPPSENNVIWVLRVRANEKMPKMIGAITTGPHDTLSLCLLQPLCTSLALGLGDVYK